MRINRNLLALAMLVALAMGNAGCGGINARQSVSPASFLVPGLMKAGPPATNAPVALPETAREVASTR